jgi:hypothetical protein
MDNLPIKTEIDGVGDLSAFRCSYRLQREFKRLLNLLVGDVPAKHLHLLAVCRPSYGKRELIFGREKTIGSIWIGACP